MIKKIVLTLTIKKADDFHLHFREGSALQTTVNHVQNCFEYVLAMPNTIPPLLTLKKTLKYLTELKKIANRKSKTFNPFTPLATIYLNQHTTSQEIKALKSHPEILGYKLYPHDVTTRSNWGIKKIKSIFRLLENMEKQDVPLLIHGESSDPKVDIFDREKVFLERELIPLTKRFPHLRITLEHITTQEAVDFVLNSHPNLKATITPHHLYINRSHLFQGGIRPHHYCLPIAKREKHRLALIKAVTSGNKKFFLGSDSAPHVQSKKENSCGCAGIYTAPFSLFLYLEVFYQAKSLSKFENFASVFGSQHYHLKKSQQTITVVREKQTIPYSYPYLKKGKLIPFKKGETIFWKIKKER